MKIYFSFLLIIFINVGPLLNTYYPQSIRKDYNEMTSDEKAAYAAAIYQLHTGVITDLADYHLNNFGLIHQNPSNEDVFLAWHRKAILEMEDSIKATNSDLILSIPYWNWVTDNSSNDPLWTDFLGQFDDDQVYEDLGRTFSGTLPSQANVNSVQSISTWSQYTSGLESSPVHNSPHNWVGGIMGGGLSPLDPVFYMHHGMIDKLWQEWEEIHGTSSYVLTSLPRYTNTNPNDIVDSRSLNVWYAEDGVVVLNNYQTSGTNEYSYTGKIESVNFTVSSGTNVTFTAGTEIFLGAGFQLQSGSTFYADVDPDVGNLSKTRFAEEENNKEKEIPGSFSLSQNYPNPFNPATIIKYTLPVNGHVTLKVYDILGKEITELVNEFKTAGKYSVNFDGSSLASGVYFYSISAGKFNQVKKMVLAK